MARVQASRSAAQAKEKRKTKKQPASAKSSGGGYKTKPVTSFVTPGLNRKKTVKSSLKKKAPSGSGVFAAMMMDSDSDSD